MGDIGPGRYFTGDLTLFASGQKGGRQWEILAFADWQIAT